MSKEIYVVGCQEDIECAFTTKEEMDVFLNSKTENVTTKYELEEIKKGDVFYVAGKPHVAGEDAHRETYNDFGFRAYVVHDENGNEYWESLFPQSKTSGWWGHSLRVYESVEEMDGDK